MDQVFIYFIRWLFLILVAFGTGMTIVILFGDSILAARMIGAFGAMFTGVLGLGTGYLLGRKQNGQANGKEGKEAA